MQIYVLIFFFLLLLLLSCRTFLSRKRTKRFFFSSVCSKFHSFLCSVRFGWILKRKLPLLVQLHSWNKTVCRDLLLNLDLVGVCKIAVTVVDSSILHFGFLFRACKFHICIFPRPQIAHTQRIFLRKHVRVRVCGYVRPCDVHVYIWYANMNSWYLMGKKMLLFFRLRFDISIEITYTNERMECKMWHRAQNCRMRRISNVKKENIMISFLPLFSTGLVVIFWYWNETVTRKIKTWLEITTNDVENPTVMIINVELAHS